MSRAAESTNIHDVSGIWGNPAIMTELGKYEVSLNLNYLLPSIAFHNASASYVDPTTGSPTLGAGATSSKVYQTLQLCLMHMQVLD